MAQVVILGSAAAIPDENHENTHLAFEGESEFILVDCAGSPLPRLKQADLDWQKLTHIIVTHFHADHVSGLPNLLINMWLLGRKEPVVLHGLIETLENTRRLMDLFGWKEMSGFYPIEFQPVPAVEMAPLLSSGEFQVFASPTHHMIPSIGLRCESRKSGRSVAYSGDTMPSEAVVRLAEGVQTLIHESTGETPGHTGPRQAAELARRAGAGHLYLIHYPPLSIADPGGMTKEAHLVFQGPVTLAQDFMRIAF